MRTISLPEGFITMRHSVVFIALIMLGCTACGKAQITSTMFDSTVDKLLSGTVDTISVSELQKTLVAQNIVLLDSRERREYEVSHLQGAQWVGYDDFNINRLDSVDTSATVVVYCSVGYRSEKIGEKLLEAGYTKVLNLYGGIFDWINQDGTLYDNNGETKNVHGYNEKWSLLVQKGKVILK